MFRYNQEHLSELYVVFNSINTVSETIITSNGGRGQLYLLSVTYYNRYFIYYVYKSSYKLFYRQFSPHAWLKFIYLEEQVFITVIRVR